MRATRFPYIRRTVIAALAGVLCLAAGPAVADADVLFTGGGIIKDGSGAEAKRITFSVNMFVDGYGVAAGHLHFNFHNLDDDYGLDQSRFTSSEFTSVYIATHYLDDTPYTFVRIEADGELNGGDGWSVLARFSDFGVPVGDNTLPFNHADALRIMLFNPEGVAVYDTALDYPREQSWRHLLDGGNVTVDIRLEPGT
jgi:hypothetical protein